MTPSPRNSVKASRKNRFAQFFVVSQIALLMLLTPFFLFSARGERIATPKLPEFLPVPLSIEPIYDDPRVITDDQLLMVLDQLEPRFGPEKQKINHVDHALRFWQLNSTFDDDSCLSGEEMRELLVNDEAFTQAWGESSNPLLVATDGGVSFRMQEGDGSMSHVDHTLASLTEVGTPLDYPIKTRDGTLTLEACLQHAVSDFSLNQLEYEWTALTLALYAPSAAPWTSKEGERIDFDRLADRIMRQRYSQGVCLGNHRLYTLAVMLRVDTDHDILTDEARERINNHLTEATRRLIASQTSEGYWEETWANDGRVPEANTSADLLRQRILATGHALEWWATAPAELHPPREVIVRAAQWLVREIESMSESTIKSNYTFLTHAGRALALWRGGMAPELREQLQPYTEP